MARGNGSGPPQFDGSGFPYWKARMQSYIESISIDAWIATSVGFEKPYDEFQAKWNARAKNAIFEAISPQVFARVRSKETAYDIWTELVKINEGTKKAREENIKCLSKSLVTLLCSLMNCVKICTLA